MRADSDCLTGSCCSLWTLFVLTAVICTPLIIMLVISPKLPTTNNATAVAEPGDMLLQSEALHTRCALNMSAVPPCEPDIGQRIEAGGGKKGNFSFRQLDTGPCSWKNALVTAPSVSDALGPFRCGAPSHGGRPAAMGLPGSIYRLSPDASRVVIQRPGLFMAIGQFTLRASWDKADTGASLPLGLAVNNRVRLLCSAIQGRPSRPGAYAYASCSVSGLLSLQAGDSVWLMAPRFGAPVEVVGLESATRLEIMLLRPLG